MKRRADSLGSLFTGHGPFNHFGEDKELLANSEDDETRVFPSKESDVRPCSSFVVQKDVSSSSWNILSDADSGKNDVRDQTNNLVNKREGSRERLYNLSLSDLFSRVGKAKIQTSRVECVERQQKIKAFDKIAQVRFFSLFQDILVVCFCCENIVLLHGDSQFRETNSFH